MSFLLLGHQRSGTSYVLDILQQHPKIDTINEPFSMHLDFFRLNEEHWRAEDFDEKYIHKSLEHMEQTADYIKELNCWLNEDFPNIRGIKETGLIEKYFWLKVAIPFNNTIILVRDFRAVIYSVLRRGMDKSWWNYRQHLIQYYGHRNEELVDDETICALLIKHRMHFLCEIIKTDKCLVVKLEELISKPEIVLKIMMNYLGLEVDASQINFMRETSSTTRDFTYSNYRTPEQVTEAWKKGLEKDSITKIEEILTDELRQFGYL